MDKEQLLKKRIRYEQFLELDPENALIMIQLGDIYHSLGEFRLAVDLFTRCLDANSNDSVSRGRLANVLLSEGRAAEAEPLLKSLLSESPEDATLNHNYGICLFALNKHEEAKSIFIPQQDHPAIGRSAQYYLASILQIEDRVPDALNMVNSLLREKEEAYLLGYKSTLLYLLERLDEALEVAERVFVLDEFNPDACSTLGTFYTEQLEFELAHKMFDRILRVSPGDVRGWHGLGILKMLKKDIPGAIESFERTTEMLPGSIAMWNTLAWAYFNARRYPDAEIAFSHVIDIDQSNPEGWGGTACAQAMQMHLDKADSSFKKAFRLDRHSFSALFAKSLIVSLRGNKDKGDQILTKVFEQPIRPGGEKAIDTINRFMKLSQVDDSAVITSGRNKNLH